MNERMNGLKIVLSWLEEEEEEVEREGCALRVHVLQLGHAPGDQGEVPGHALRRRRQGGWAIVEGARRRRQGALCEVGGGG